jgi:excisionase family DNA binding protein
MESIVFTQLSIEEIRQLLREEVQFALEDHISKQQVQKNKSEYLDISQLSDYIDLAVPTIYNLVSKGEIPHIKRGKKLRFEPEMIDKWLKEGRRKANFEIRENAKMFMLKDKTKKTKHI